jgi:hypothetical protein
MVKLDNKDPGSGLAATLVCHYPLTVQCTNLFSYQAVHLTESWSVVTLTLCIILPNLIKEGQDSHIQIALIFRLTLMQIHSHMQINSIQIQLSIFIFRFTLFYNLISAISH